MNGWRRYPGRLAHRVDEVVEPILGTPDEAGYRPMIGKVVETTCRRRLNVFWTRPWSAGPVDVDELRESSPRGWCLRCGYWTAREALILPPIAFEAFVDLVYAGRYRLV